MSAVCGTYFRRLFPALLLGVIMAAPAASLSAAAEESARGVRDACFAPTEIAAKAGELAARKGDRTFDRPEPSRALSPFAPVPAALRGSIRSVRLPKGEKLIALTLDLCEQPGEIAGYDGAVIDYLRREGIKATLFAGGKWLRSHEIRSRQLIGDPQFEIANHSAAHRNLRLLSGQRLRDEIEAPQRAYEAIHERFASERCIAAAGDAWQSVPKRMRLFRFPYGACNQASLDAVNDAGLLAIQWNLSTGDPWPGQSAKAIARAVLSNVKPGAIVIGHANGRGYHMAEALPLFIPKLKADGYRFVTVSELIAAGTPEIAATCYNAKPGDTDRYDNLVAALARPRAGTKAPANGAAIPWAPTVKRQPGKTGSPPQRQKARS